MPWRVANQKKEMLPFLACGSDRLTSLLPNGKLCQQGYFSNVSVVASKGVLTHTQPRACKSLNTSCHFSTAALHYACYRQTDVKIIPFSTLGFPAKAGVFHSIKFVLFLLNFNVIGVHLSGLAILLLIYPA